MDTQIKRYFWEKSTEVLVSYCSNYTALDIKKDVLQKGRSTIMGPGTSHPYRTASFSAFPGLNFTALPAAI